MSSSVYHPALSAARQHHDALGETQDGVGMSTRLHGPSHVLLDGADVSTEVARDHNYSPSDSKLLPVVHAGEASKSQHSQPVRVSLSCSQNTVWGGIHAKLTY